MILVAPDSFKGSLTAREVAEIVGGALRAADPDRHVHLLPLADGGEGTVDRAVDAGLHPVTVEVSGPLGDPIAARYATDGDLAVVEMAAAAGLSVLPGEPDAHTARVASTHGVGELLGHAIDHGAGRIVLGLGGSATTDGGAGLAEALGAIVSGRDGVRVARGGAALVDVTDVDLDPMIDRLAGVEIVLATDVDAPLTGPLGAARVFGAQKGATATGIRSLEFGLEHWADVLASATGVDARRRPGSGAAGGTGMPLLAAGCGRVESGIDVVMEMVDIERSAGHAELVVVGEGSLDAQSLRGKGTVGVARWARSNGARTVAIVGQNRLTAADVDAAAIDRVYAMTDIESDLRVCLSEPASILRRLADRLAGDLADDLAGELAATERRRVAER